MFTGIIQCIGTLARGETRGGDLRLAIAAPELDFSDVAIGDSICVSGCCLTVVARDGDALAFDVSKETLSLTTLGALREGDRKSTRLNSSHPSISYAVFCLKKKKHTR